MSVKTERAIAQMIRVLSQQLQGGVAAHPDHDDLVEQRRKASNTMAAFLTAERDRVTNPMYKLAFEHLRSNLSANTGKFNVGVLNMAQSIRIYPKLLAHQNEMNALSDQIDKTSSSYRTCEMRKASDELKALQLRYTIQEIGEPQVIAILQKCATI